MRKYILERLCEAAEKDNRIVFLTADLGFEVVEGFKRRFNDRFFNLGVAEQNMLGVAAGLTLEGKKVFVYSMGNFISLRCLEQIRNELCYLNLDINIISVGCGLESGKLGFSHISSEDIACILSLPQISLYSPANKAEAELCLQEMIKRPGAKFLRVGHCAGEYACKSLDPLPVIKGTKCALFCTGGIIEEGIKAAKAVEGLAVYSLPRLRPLGEKRLAEEISKYKYVFSLEEHSPIGGLSGVFERIIAKNPSICSNFYKFGFKEQFCGWKGSRDFLLSCNQIDAKSIAKIINKIVK